MALRPRNPAHAEPPLTRFAARPRAIVDRPGAFLQESAVALMPNRHDLGDDRLGYLVRSFGAEVQPGGAGEPRAVLVGDRDALLLGGQRDPSGTRGGRDTRGAA